MQVSTMLFESNPLVKVIPGLMIWTIIAFAITFFVLRRYAFGPIQKLIDDRRERIRESVEEADRVREEARSLLEEHKALIGQARSEAESILAEARKLADAQHAADARGDRGRPAAAARGDRASDRAGQGAGAHRAAAGGGCPVPRGSREDHPQDADRRRPEAPDRRGARRDRLLAAGGEPLIATAQRIYAKALFEAAEDKGRLDLVREQLGDLAHSIGEVPELASVLENPETDSRVKADVLEQILGGGDELIRNFVRVVVEKGRAGEIRGIAAEFEALVAARAHVLDVELTTASELSDADFEHIVNDIEKRSGRTVQASRSVDPDLIGGIVLQAGSLRLDASLRGRLDRLRQELATTRS